MHTQADIAALLKRRLSEKRITQAKLRQDAGLSQRTLTKVLSGEEDFKVSTLLALADRLDLELVLIPKNAAAAVAAGTVAPPAVKSVVQNALDKVRKRQDASGTSS